MMKTIKMLSLTVVLCFLLASSAVQAISGPTVTYGNLSVGKFYKYNYTPHPSYPDIWPNEWTDGARLTDEEMAAPWPLDKWVDWVIDSPYTLEVVLDLGKVYELDEIRLHTTSRTVYGIYYPEQVRFYYRQSVQDNWTQYGNAQQPGSDTEGYSECWLGVKSDFVQARYVKYELDGPVGNHLFLDEIEVYGNILNSWKNVPDWGCYHGAYPSNTLWWLDIPNYENTIQKQTSMALWYATMGSCDFKDYLGSLWRKSTCLPVNLDHQGARYLEVGWEAGPNVTTEQIAGGFYDSYYKQFFTESIDYSNRLGNIDPVWLRINSEMNGGWTFPGNPYNEVAYGGDPLNYRRSWRRLYNIAEQVGAADHHIFVWSPNGYNYSGPEHDADKYYPGDQYVDWIGVSVYVQGTTPYPINIIDGTSGAGGIDFYGTWPYKPMIISEGSFVEKDGVDGEEWIRQWFELPHRFPNIKAMVWFFISGGTFDAIENEPYQSLYRSLVADDFFLRQSVAGVVDVNRDFNVDLVDFAAMSQNWLGTQSNLVGDINGDNKVDFRDFVIMEDLWLK